MEQRARMMVGYGTEAIDGRELSSREHSSAGVVSGVVSRCFIQPLDVIKIRFQLQEEPLHGSLKGKYSGMFQAFCLIRREETLAALWKGHIPAQGLSALYGMVQFTSFELLTQAASKRFHLTSSSRIFTDTVCGAMAGCLAITATMPLDVVRTRLIAQGEPKIYRGTFHAFILIWRMEGISGYFRGLLPSLIQIAPFTGTQFFLYNRLVILWERVFHGYEAIGTFLCGAMAGTTSKTCIYPFDLIRHRLQMRGFKRMGFGKTSQCYTMIGAVVHVVKNERIFGLFKGLWPAMIKSAAYSGFSFFTYKLALDVFRKW